MECEFGAGFTEFGEGHAGLEIPVCVTVLVQGGKVDGWWRGVECEVCVEGYAFFEVEVCAG